MRRVASTRWSRSGARSASSGSAECVLTTPRSHSLCRLPIREVHHSFARPWCLAGGMESAWGQRERALVECELRRRRRKRQWSGLCLYLSVGRVRVSSAAVRPAMERLRGPDMQHADIPVIILNYYCEPASLLNCTCAITVLPFLLYTVGRGRLRTHTRFTHAGPLKYVI